MRNIHKQVNSDDRYLVVNMIEHNSSWHRFLRETFNRLHTLILPVCIIHVLFPAQAIFRIRVNLLLSLYQFSELDSNNVLFT